MNLPSTKQPRAPKLYSYVVEHIRGFAPHVDNYYCTLVHCKFSQTGFRKNVIELANVGDWIIGTGGKSSESSGKGTVVYLMRIDEKIPFHEFMKDKRFMGRDDQKDLGTNTTFALISKCFYYFGKQAVNLREMPNNLCAISIEKSGPAYRADFTVFEIQRIVSAFEERFAVGNYENGSITQSSCTVTCNVIEKKC